MTWQETGVFMAQFWSQIWRIFQVELPYVGLTFGQILIGNFIVMLSIRIFKAYFGLPSVFALSQNKREKRYERKDDNALDYR